MSASEFLAGQRVLVVAPHADDETLGCGGTIARIKALGGEVFCVLGSFGGIAQYRPGAEMEFVSGDTRRAEFEAVMSVLGVDGWDVLFGDEHHMALDRLPLAELVARIERQGALSLHELAPTMLFAPAPTYNQDHRALFEACLAATRPGPPGRRHHVGSVLLYDSGGAQHARAGNGFAPSVFVDISEFVQLKQKALSIYTSQLVGVTESDDVPGMVRSRAYGHGIGVSAAEAFEPIRLAV